MQLIGFTSALGLANKLLECNDRAEELEQLTGYRVIVAQKLYGDPESRSHPEMCYSLLIGKSGADKADIHETYNTVEDLRTDLSNFVAVARLTKETADRSAEEDAE